ncbi:hypothetical protein [Bradyrhizobium sp. SYSU BS000235]|uniref:hypothetical protein n=1 Tax=Bradyrhizobium sp. SYSU BS000235 TaxID=3411332 RepID=UPI003C78F901
MLKFFARKLSVVQTRERAKSMVIGLLRLDKTSPLLERTAKEISKLDGNQDANEYFVAGVIILEMDRAEMRSESSRKYLQSRFQTLQGLSAYYQRKAKMVEDLWSRQVGADTGIPKDAYKDLLLTAKKYWQS